MPTFLERISAYFPPRCTNVDPDNLVSEEKEQYWVQFDYGIIDDATDEELHPFNTMVLTLEYHSLMGKYTYPNSQSKNSIESNLILSFICLRL